MNNQLFKTAFYIFNKYAAIEELTENEVSKNHAILVNIFNDINKVFNKTTNRTDDSDLIFELMAEIARKYDACVFSKDFSKISYEKGKRQDGSSDRAFTSVGKFIKNKTTVGKNINDSLLREICQLYNTEISKYKPITDTDYTSLIGNDVANKYKEYGLNTIDNSNTETSCMTGKPDLVQLYALNSDKVQLLTLKNAPVRCLLWTCDDGVKVLDRIYPAQNNYIPKIIGWAKQNGILYRKNHDRLCTDSVIELSDGSTRTVTLENLPEKYPYIDTFCYGRFNQDGSLTLSNNINVGKITFHYTDGTFKGKDEYSPTFNVCENCGTSVDPDDVTFVDEDMYCPECYFELFFECANCYETYPQNELNYHNGNRFCDSCYNQMILKC